MKFDIIYEADDNGDEKEGKERDQWRGGGVFKLEIRAAPP